MDYFSHASTAGTRSCRMLNKVHRSDAGADGWSIRYIVSATKYQNKAIADGRHLVYVHTHISLNDIIGTCQYK